MIISRILGVGAVGVTSAAVSAAGVASTLVAAGLPIAVMREVAAHGPRALRPSATVSLILGSVSALLAYVMVSALPTRFGIPAWVPAVLALTTVASMAALQALVGLGRFRGYFASVLTASLAKVLLGVGLAVLGFGVLAPLIGYVSYPVVVLATASTLLLVGTGLRPLTDPGSGGGSGPSPLSVLKLSLSNYPFVFSTQILNMLSVYFFAVLTGSAVSTGVLYLSLMIVLMINAVVGSALTASLSVGLRRGVDPFTNTLRVALGIAAPIAAAASVAPTLPLHLVNPALVSGAPVLAILAMTVPPTATLTAAIMKANKEGNHALIAAVGAARLATLLALLPPLTKLAGTQGVALAYLAANIAPLPAAIKHLPGALKPLTVTWGTQATLTVTTLLTLPNPTLTQATATAAAAAVATLAATHATGTLNVKEITDIATTLTKKNKNQRTTH